MGIEIERKFLLKNQDWKRSAQGVPYRQGYLCLDPERTVRVRIAADQGVLTIKGASIGNARSEFEYLVPLEEACEMLDQLCHRPQIEKTRYRVPHAGLMWEIDEFHGDNAGLVMAEVELETSDQQLELPHWAGIEVTGDERYYNAYLSQHPYRGWKDDER